MSIWHLLWIVPLSVLLGSYLMAVIVFRKLNLWK